MAGRRSEHFARLLEPMRMYEYAPILISLGALVFGRRLFPWLVVPGVRRMEEFRRHTMLGHRFLCPRCLHFGPLVYGCGDCGREMDAAWVFTPDPPGARCPYCGAGFAPRIDGIPSGVRAHCVRCSANEDPDLYHERQVRVLAVLSEEDLNTFCESTPRQTWTRGKGFAWAEDGQRLTHVLEVEPFFRTREPDHAIRAIESIWVDGSVEDLPQLNRRLTRYLGREGNWPSGRREMGVFVRPAEISPVVVDHLVCLGSVRPGVSAEVLMEGLPARLPGTLAMEPVPIVATLLPQDFMKVWSAMDERHRWLLRSGWAVEERPRQTTYLVDLSRPDRSPLHGRLVLRCSRVDAIWIDIEGMEPLYFGRVIDQLDRWADGAGVRLRRLAACVPQQEVAPMFCRLLESRFGEVRYGWSAQQFLHPPDGSFRWSTGWASGSASDRLGSTGRG